jgi:hypothetical protein
MGLLKDAITLYITVILILFFQYVVNTTREATGSSRRGSNTH